MAIHSTLLFLYSSLLSISFSLLLISSHAHGDVTRSSWHVVAVGSLLPASVCSPSKGSNPTKLKVVHRHGPCSPLSHQKLSHTQILSQDQSRVDSLHRRASKQPPITGSLAAAIPAHTGASFGTGNYVVTVGLGTPKLDFPLIFDTGSSLTWIQCTPCTDCYPQQSPLFTPSQSSTHQNISCTSPTCSSLLDSPSCSADSRCRYTVQYGDNSQTAGFFVKDTLTLTPLDSIPNFFFGCGDQSSGLFGQTSGLIGLDREQVSLIMQTRQKYNGVFSYCLPSTSSSSGYLQLGGRLPNNIMYTSMLSDSNMSSFYLLSLTSISVGGRRLPIPPTTFSNPGTIIDSGTVITRLPPSAYSTLRSAFRQKMVNYPTAPAVAILDTCYNFTGYGTVTVPTVALGFANGVTVNVDFSGILYVTSVSQACLAFAGNGDESDVVIIGNLQQKKLSVVYDLANQKIGFGPHGCS